MKRKKTDQISKENKEFYKDLAGTIKIQLDDNKSQIKQLIENERNQIKQQVEKIALALCLEMFENISAEQVSDIAKYEIDWNTAL